MKDLDTALIPRCLPDELLFEIFSRTDPYTLGKAACVCQQWRDVIHNPVFWRNACLKAWQITENAENDRILESKYDGSWRKMWILRPRVRTDGLYVSRKTYTLAGATELKITNPVRVIYYYSYIRFHPSGKFLYTDSSQKVKDMAKCMNFQASKADPIFRGHYTLLEDLVEGSIFYLGTPPTMQRIRLSLSGTTPGANNRMDLLALVSSGVHHNEVDVPVPFIFVPFEEVDTSFLNLPC